MRAAETKELVHAAVNLLSEIGDCADSANVLAQQTGRSVSEASDALNFVPFAFARVLFEVFPVRFPDTYLLRTSEGECEQAFAHNGMYQAAIEEARTMRIRGPRSRFQAIASQSPEFGCVNQALNSGVKVDDLSSALLARPVIWRP